MGASYGYQFNLLQMLQDTEAENQEVFLWLDTIKVQGQGQDVSGEVVNKASAYAIPCQEGRA